MGIIVMRLKQMKKKKNKSIKVTYTYVKDEMSELGLERAFDNGLFVVMVFLSRIACFIKPSRNEISSAR